MNNWIKCSDLMPPKETTVWAYNINTNHIALADYSYVANEGWFWNTHNMNGSIYVFNGKIIAETELDDDYEFTHWQFLPKLPTE